jgi:hypothetical protein
MEGLLPKLEMKLSDDASSLELGFDTAGYGSTVMTASQVENLIRALIAFRMTMASPLQLKEVPEGTVILEEEGMRWWLGVKPHAGHVVLAFNHPVLGRMSIPLGEDSTREVIKTMGHVAELLSPYVPMQAI